MGREQLHPITHFQHFVYCQGDAVGIHAAQDVQQAADAEAGVAGGFLPGEIEEGIQHLQQPIFLFVLQHELQQAAAVDEPLYQGRGAQAGVMAQDVVVKIGEAAQAARICQPKLLPQAGIGQGLAPGQAPRLFLPRQMVAQPRQILG